MKVTDKAGNTSGWVNGVSFVYDTATPVISLTAANPAEGTYTNTGFTLEATASDTYGVDSVKAVGKVTLNTAPVNWAAVYSKYKTDEACTTAAASTFAAGTYYYPVTLALSSGKYTKAVSTTDIADGKYEFTVTATDRAAKPASVKRTFTIDTIAPQGSFETNNFSPVKAYTENSRDWYSEKAVTFSLRVTDENIDTVEGSLDGTNYSGFSLKNSSYVGTLTGLEEGKNTVTVRMTDKAGNSNSVSTVIYVDKQQILQTENMNLL